MRNYEFVISFLRICVPKYDKNLTRHMVARNELCGKRIAISRQRNKVKKEFKFHYLVDMNGTIESFGFNVW